MTAVPAVALPVAASSANHRRPPAVLAERADATIDVRAFARSYVSVLLELEGVRITPTAIAEAR